MLRKVLSLSWGNLLRHDVTEPRKTTLTVGEWIIITKIITKIITTIISTTIIIQAFITEDIAYKKLLSDLRDNILLKILLIFYKFRNFLTTNKPLFTYPNRIKTVWHHKNETWDIINYIPLTTTLSTYLKNLTLHSSTYLICWGIYWTIIEEKRNSKNHVTTFSFVRKEVVSNPENLEKTPLFYLNANATSLSFGKDKNDHF